MISAIVMVILGKPYPQKEPVAIMVLDKVSQPVIMHDKPRAIVTPGAHGQQAPKTTFREMYIGVEVALQKVPGTEEEIYRPVNGQPYFFLPEQITDIVEVSFMGK